MLLATLSCSKPQPLYQEQLLALGALVDISIWGVEPEPAQQAADAVTEDFNRIHRTWHAWQESDLTRINAQLPGGAPFPVQADLMPLIGRAQELSRQSEGLFNPAIGKLIGLWGFHGDEPKGPPPDAAAVAALVAQHPNMDDLRLGRSRCPASRDTSRTLRYRSSLCVENNLLQSRNPAVQLDFGAIGQGYAVDVAIEHLRQLGIENAIVNASGDIRVIGKHGARPWRIGIRNPRGPGILASIEMQGDESIVTSGTYERFFEYDGQRYHHIIDPRSGYPARGLVSVTVLHSDAVTADAASTALLVAGLKDWRRIASNMGVKQAMLIDEQGTVYMDAVLARRMHFEIAPAPKVEITDTL
ncbi:MAG: FAD:protein FMN transferase [Gammaproteobacteria bacterium]|nr:FAD:protein FMN transferase [Gammaproteobacteria bacterium]